VTVGADIPSWTRDVDRALAAAMREIPLLGAATPQGGLKRVEIIRAFESGGSPVPRWTHVPLESARAAARATALESLAEAVEGREPSPLAQVYAARARELALESLLASEVGSAGFALRARDRFHPEGTGSVASHLAREWARDPEPAPPADRTSDGSEPGSLASRLREEIGRHCSPFRVVVADGLAPLAATGDRTVWVAAGRSLSQRDIERTVLHEIEGHVLPRARASALLPGIFAIGTARGTDDQEGLALVLEERHGFLRGARRRELALRHRAIEAMDDGGTFVEVVRTLVGRDGAAIEGAVAAAERAFRGSAGETPGLGRERIYLSAYLRVKERLGEKPGDERVMASGQVALDAIDALRDCAR
jgi:Domain of unknown function (DUF1704)